MIQTSQTWLFGEGRSLLPAQGLISVLCFTWQCAEGQVKWEISFIRSYSGWKSPRGLTGF